MKQALDTRTKLLTKNPWPLMIELSIPAVLGMVVVGLYNMMDSIFVGQMVGDVQMGAISVSYPLTLINAGSAAMLGVGSASVLSRAIGKKDENTIKKIMGNLVAMVLLLSVIYTVVFGGPWDDPWNLYRCSEQQKSGCPDCESQGNTLCTWAQYHKEYFSGVNSDERKFDYRLHRKSELRKDNTFQCLHRCKSESGKLARCNR